MPLLLLIGLLQAEADVDFARDVRPLLSDRCFKCHGPDPKTLKGKLRLDVRAAALAKKAVVPGDPKASLLVERIRSADPDEQMPPPAEVKQLSARDKDVLERWIRAGAPYAEHWAFVAPRDPPIPAPRRADWARTPIDRFVLARLEAAGLAPRPEADRAALARRLSLDLIGLPPTPEEVEAFVRDAAPDAYERHVDRLLASPRFGERWARRWMDLARYADTNGYEKDRPRVIWPWRDWVIRAYNEDLPFDRFTILQLAGDMLPGASISDRVATGFHRNTMINEEGGIDPLEFRFHALVDRVNTTGTVWLGLTLQCAQCHTHKYDPLPHDDYYRLMAFFDGADEPTIEVPQADVEARRTDVRRRISEAEAALPSRFPPDGALAWTPVRPVEARSAGKADLEVLDDASVRAGGERPEKDAATLVFDAELGGVEAVRLEVLTDPALPKSGPGRADNGNFVLSELVLKLGERALRFASASADHEQTGFPASAAIDGKADTGWAVATAQGSLNVPRAATFTLDGPAPAGARWTLALDQAHGTKHTLGRFRVSVGRPSDPAPPAERRARHLAEKRAAWLREEEARAIDWSVLKPASAVGSLPLLAVEPEGAVFVHGDMSKRDVYSLSFDAGGRRVTALRLEALTDPRLPAGGPGRVHYEGPTGDFWLSELGLSADGAPRKLSGATQTYADGDKTAAKAIDGDPQTGWSIKGGVGRAQTAVFRLDPPAEGVRRLDLTLLFERYYAAGLGRFRVSITSDERPAEARGHPADVEAALRTAPERRTPAMTARLEARFLEAAPELAAARSEIEKLRASMPSHPTTLVLQEREPEHRRKTRLRRRGEYLSPEHEVAPGVLSLVPALPGGVPSDRLGFARWLVHPEHPLTARVAMNRLWAAVFGQGLVRTLDDFGLQGELPSHPELLDWLAREFVRRGWSHKAMLRLIATSAVYRQDATTTAEARAKDPENRLLSRSPRTRLDAELIRDSALRVSGLLSDKIGGPSVFPPQVPGITTEGTYGPLTWKTSTGQDRYRRGLYTFAKRTAPYAMAATFDAPSGEACLARREVSNTPLQALTLLNDEVFVEAARHAGRAVAAEPGDDRAARLFRRFLARAPTDDELARIEAFRRAQAARLETRPGDAARIAGAPGADVAAWVLVARALLNLDEFVTRN